MTEPLLAVRNLKTYFYTEDGPVKSVDGVSFVIEPERTVAMVGESGCGKSVTALSIMRLIPSPPGKIVEGNIFFYQKSGVVDLASIDEDGAEIRSIRGKNIAMIFQEPMTSLNPVYTVGKQIMEVLRLHQGLSKKEALNKAVEILNAVGIPSPEQKVKEYPHELSGGMRQRAMIAMALSCNPSLLIADEPTTALDVTVQAQVLKLMNSIRERSKTAILFITHNMGIVAKMADYVIVMYLGRIVESGPVRDIFYKHLHPYTDGLMGAIPSLSQRKGRLIQIPGTIPEALNLPNGCSFEPRCSHSMEICRMQFPPVEEVRPGHFVSCWLIRKENV